MRAARSSSFSSFLQAHLTHFFLLLLALTALLRVLLSLYPKVAAIYQDELFYTELAQNLWTRGLTVYETPVHFTKVLYPLLLSPFYAVSSGPLRASLISVFNALLLSSSLIPGFLLARRVLKDPARILLALLFLALSPNLLFSLTFMAENLYFPLLLWGFYLAYRFFTAKDPSPARALLLGFWAFLLYLTKEVGAAWFLSLLFLLLRPLFSAPSRAAAARALGCFLGGFLLPFLLVRFVLFGSAGFTYASQASLANLPDASHLMYLLWAALLHLLYFTLSLCFVPVALPLSRFRRFADGDRQFLLLTSVYVLCAAFGIAFGISLAEDFPSADLRIHLRYLLCAGFPFLLLTLADPEEDPRPAEKKKAGALFAAAAVFALLFGLLTLLPRFGSPVDSPLLHVTLWLSGLSLPWVWVGKGLLILLSFLLLYICLFRHSRRIWMPLGCLLVIALQIANCAFLVPDLHRVEEVSPDLSARAEALSEAAREEGRLLVVTDDVQSHLLKAFNTYSGRDYTLLTTDQLVALYGEEQLAEDSSLPLSQTSLPVNIIGFALPETISPEGVDAVLVLPETEEPLLDPGAYEDITPPEASPSLLLRAKDPARLSLLDRRSCWPDQPVLFYGDSPSFLSMEPAGLSAPEASYTWSQETEVSLTFRPRVPEPRDLLLTWAYAATNGEQFCSIQANGTPVADLFLNTGDKPFTFMIPAETYADSGIVTLTFFFPDAREPGNGDPRLLAVAFESITLNLQ